MKPTALIAVLCLMFPALSAQELAPASAGGMLYTAAPTTPRPGSFWPSHAAVLSPDGSQTPIGFGVPAGSIRTVWTYTWIKTGANTATLTLSNPTMASELAVTFTSPGKGTYRETMMRTGDVVLGNFQLAPVPNDPTPPLLNTSVRATLAGGQTAVQGFVVSAGPPRRVLVRAIGPSLALFGVANPATNPALTVYRSSAQIAANTGWGGVAELATVFAKVGAFSLSATSHDSAVVLSLEPGNYSAHARDANGGEVLLEVYFVD
jgi:hypothetical protein